MRTRVSFNPSFGWSVATFGWTDTTLGWNDATFGLADWIDVVGPVPFAPCVRPGVAAQAGLAVPNATAPNTTTTNRARRNLLSSRVEAARLCSNGPDAWSVADDAPDRVERGPVIPLPALRSLPKGPW
jgi:hypothetical protein